MRANGNLVVNRVRRTARLPLLGDVDVPIPDKTVFGDNPWFVPLQRERHHFVSFRPDVSPDRRLSVIEVAQLMEAGDCDLAGLDLLAAMLLLWSSRQTETVRQP
jgi:hypothetical protein